MSNTIAKLMTAAVIAVAVPLYAGIASAAPVSGAFAIKNAAPSNIENVRYYGWRGGWGRGYYGGGWGVGAGIAAGALIAGALAAPYYYGGGPYYGAPTTTLRGPATTLSHTATAWLTACNGTGHTIREAGRSLATMDIAIRARERVAAAAWPHSHCPRTKTPARRRGFLFASVIFRVVSHSQNLQGGKSRL